MNSTFRAAVAALYLAALPGLPVNARDKVVISPGDDKEMAAAMTEAKKMLPEFWGMVKAPQPGVGGFALKVGIKDAPGSDYIEYFWLSALKPETGDKLSGTISNDPNHVKSVRRGQRYVFGQSEIVDWMFMRNGKIVGNYTMRPLLARMPKAQADTYRAMLEKP